MADAGDLYRLLIIEHSKRPRSTTLPEPASHSGEGNNPLCGDRLTVAVRVSVPDRDVPAADVPWGVIEDIGCRAQGCAISVAAGSTMSEAVRGKSMDDIQALYRRYLDVLHGRASGGEGERPGELGDLGDLAAFAGIAAFPLRSQCATLAWKTLLDMLGLDSR